MKNVEVNFRGYDCKILKDEYKSGGTALTLIDVSDGEVVAVASVNIEEHKRQPGHVLIKNWSENEGMLEVLERAGVVQRTGETVHNGYVEAHVCRLLI